MNRTDLARIVSQKTGISQEKTNLVLIHTFETILEEMFNQNITISNFGVFCIEKRPGRKIVHPKTGEVSYYPSKFRPRFILSREKGKEI
jgi:nucleoid DNA-binding protein